jgi:para-nitrobenzyl esterase
MQTIRSRHEPLAGVRAVTLALAALALPSVAAAQTLIDTTDGPVQGQQHELTREWLGIPYAAPPVGTLRFKPPQSPAPWVDALDATTYPQGCAQLPVLTNNNTRIENEDCLYLNVWSPDPAPVEALPVMVWIHGGSNTSGSTADFVPFPDYDSYRLYDGHFMAQGQNVVVVTINYRLNVFGFLGLPELKTEDPSFPYAGNQGLLDQRKALEWVRDNIAAFGGNPDNVTIYGESAGSWDVCAHVMSPLSRGLFHRAISESGGCSVGVQSDANAAEAAAIVAEAVGCDEAPDRLACMRDVPVGQLLDAGPLVALAGETTNLGISVDGGFLTEHPRVTLDAGELPKIPYILGANKDEGTLFFIGSDEITAEQYTAELVSTYGAFAPQVEALYPAASFATPRDALIRVTGDARLVCSTYDVARRYAKGRKTYVYNFQRVPPLTFISLLELGAFHGLEIGYVFGSVPPPSPADEGLGTQMQQYWSTFAAKGKPKSLNKVAWPRFNPKSWKMLRFGTPVAKMAGYNKAQCDFWTTVYEAGDF